MKPQDIDKIANLVVGSLSGAPGAGLLGCGSVTSAVDYDAAQCVGEQLFACTDGYECGGMADFTCCQGFECLAEFDCPGGAMFGCGGDLNFACPQVAFTCGAGDTFKPTGEFCDRPI